MAKLIRGRLAGLHGMESYTAEELHAEADTLLQQARLADPADDPGWLRRWAEKLRRLAEQKEKARERKSDSRSGR